MCRIKTGRDTEPFYFNSNGERLFGLLLRPNGTRDRQCGVILCSPYGHEYIQFHRAYRELSIRLTKSGFHVLRFDYFGTGDSAGSRTDGSIEQWKNDIAVAIEELRMKTGINKICLAGLRLGGTLAVMAAAVRNDINSIILLDPVYDGVGYIEELRLLHKDMLEYAHVNEKHIDADKDITEVLGFPYTDDLIQEIKNINLFSVDGKPASNALLIETHDQISQEPLKNKLESEDVHVDYTPHHNPHLWVWVEDFSRVLVPHTVLQTVVKWLSGTYA